MIALALGADAVGVGRPVLWALAHGGEDGVADYLHGVVDGMGRALTMMGVPTPTSIPRDLLVADGTTTV